MAPCVPSPGRGGIPGASCRQEEGGPGDRGAGCKASHARPSPCRKSTRTLPGASQAAGHALEEGADSPLCREPGRPEIRHADGADENQDVKASQEVRPPLTHGRQDEASRGCPLSLAEDAHGARARSRQGLSPPPSLPSQSATVWMDCRAGPRVQEVEPRD